MLPLSAEAREAVDRIAARRQRERDLRVRRETAVRARILQQEMVAAAEVNAARWAPENNPAHKYHSTSSIPAQIIEYLGEHDEAHTSRLALALQREYDAIRQALGRLERNGEVTSREHHRTKWWRLAHLPPASMGTRHPNQKIDLGELAGFVAGNPGVTVFEAAAAFDAHPETMGRRLRWLRQRGVVESVMVDPAAAAEWYAAGDAPTRGRRGAAPVLNREKVVAFVRDNPGSTSAEVARGVSAPNQETCRRVLGKLRGQGRVRNVAAGSNTARWEVA